MTQKNLGISLSLSSRSLPDLELNVTWHSSVPGRVLIIALYKIDPLSLSLSLSLSSRLLWCVAVLIVALFLSGHYLSCSLACSLSLSPRWYFCAWLSDDITLSPCYFCALLSVLISLSLSLSLSLYLSISHLELYGGMNFKF